MPKDFYKILGVAKAASTDEVKTAFRKLAHEHHPDKKGGNAEKFKEINEAYQALGDAQTRAQYDQYGSSFEQMRRQGFQGAGFDPREFGFDIGDLSDLFGGLGEIFGFGVRSGGHGRQARESQNTRNNQLNHSPELFNCKSSNSTIPRNRRIVYRYPFGIDFSSKLA